MTATHDDYRADFDHYWRRLMWYRDELWRITTPVWAVYGAFIASCIGYVWSSGKGNIAGETALMLIVVILTFSWVIQRMYWTYAHRIYAAITELNNEVRKREQHIYDHILQNGRQADYGRFRVYPELNVIFSIVGVALMFASIFTVAASVEFRFFAGPPAGTSAASPALGVFHMLMICLWLVMLFEFVLLKFKKHCEVCGAKSLDGPRDGPTS